MESGDDRERERNGNGYRREEGGVRGERERGVKETRTYN